MTVLFDTLKLAERLEAAGMPSRQARETAAAFADTFTDTVATRADIAALREHIDRSIEGLRTEFSHEIAAVRTEIAAVRADMTSLETRLMAAMDRRDLYLTVRILGIVAALNGLLFALLKLT